MVVTPDTDWFSDFVKFDLWNQIIRQWVRLTEIRRAYSVNLFYETGLEALEVRLHKMIYDLLSVWTKEMNAIIFFSIASYCIVLYRIEIESHCIVIGVNRIVSCFVCIFNVSYRWLCIEMRISVMEMHKQPKLLEH